MDKHDRLAKALSVGIKHAIRISKVPLNNLAVDFLMTTDEGNIVGVRMSGVPPFTTTVVTVNGDTRTFVGHPDVPSQGKQDPS